VFWFGPMPIVLGTFAAGAVTVTVLALLDRSTEERA
jgi:uncharacterized membrane protein